MSRPGSHYDDYFLSGRQSLEEIYRSIDEHLAAGGSLGDHEVRRAVYYGFFDVNVPDASALPEDEVQLVFGPSAVTEHDAESIASRAALYSTCSHFVTPYTFSREVFPDPYDEYGRPESYTLDISGRFVELAMQLKPYILGGCLRLAPMTSTYVGSRVLRPYANAENSQLLAVLLDDELPDALKTHIGAAAVEIPLRAVSGARADDVLKIRAEYHEQFLDFQRALAAMISSSPEEGERVLSESIALVGEEVRRLDEQMEALRRKNWFETMKLALTPLPMLLPLSPRL